MTTLMYRGFAHDGVRQPRPVATHYLIYRGVQHIGRTERDLKPMHAIEMIYRGVRNVRLVPNLRHDTTTTQLTDAVW